MPSIINFTVNSGTPLQLVLFVDRRPGSRDRIRKIRSYLQDLRQEYIFDFQIVDVAEQPYLAEHFKVIATPALIKIHPEPREMLAGSNLATKLEQWWSRWQRSVEDYVKELNSDPNAPRRLASPELINSAELMRLSEEIFQLKQKNEELQEHLRFKDQLIRMLAHDLRNPLTAASLALSTLESTQDPSKSQIVAKRPEFVPNLIKQARTKIRTLDGLIADILEAARGASAQFCLQPEKLDLAELCEHILADFSERLRSKSLKLEIDIPNDLPPVYADPERVRQVIVNLLDNACKYTPEGGTIQFSILHRTSQKVQVSICDNGPGIPPENQEHIFDDRFRLERDAKEDGYGIGLSVCRRLIRAHYGQIWVDSIPDNGSEFHFTLPVYRY
ncbi:MAG: histidine kinase [Oscillatoria sp. SIO1A7]|nr:histidine kinase [Oscillatoria sp. SIO1A7]